MGSQSDEIPGGMRRPSAVTGDYNQVAFAISQALGKLQTSTLVRVERCTNSGGLSAVGFVDITPLVNQVDAFDQATPHTTIYNVPYFRLQGGANAIIIDPEPGDIGIACFASRDITVVKATKDAANPGSRRCYSFSDALYIGGMLNAVPSQYIQFNSDGIKIHSPVTVVVQAPSVTLDTPIVTMTGDCDILGQLNVTGDAHAAGTSVHTHRHNGDSGGQTSAPI